jgi:hypothetical protein
MSCFTKISKVSKNEFETNTKILTYFLCFPFFLNRFFFLFFFTEIIKRQQTTNNNLKYKMDLLRLD